MLLASPAGIRQPSGLPSPPFASFRERRTILLLLRLCMYVAINASSYIHEPELPGREPELELGLLASFRTTAQPDKAPALVIIAPCTNQVCFTPNAT